MLRGTATSGAAVLPAGGHTTPPHRTGRPRPGVLTRNHAHHYRGFAGTQWRLYAKTGELKPLLYTFRVLLTGIHLMRGGHLLAHLPTCSTRSTPPRIPGLIEAKAEAEYAAASDLDGGAVARDTEGRHSASWTTAGATRRLRESRDGFADLQDRV